MQPSSHSKQQLESGLVPIFVGGTGLYFKALTDGLAEVPPIPDDDTGEVAEF